MEIIPINPKAGVWGVESENPRTYAKHYTVKITGEQATCTCPHSVYRNAPDCKHRAAVRSYLADQTPLAKAADRAASLTQEELQRFARERNGTVAGCACLLELAARRVADQREQELKKLFG